MNTRTRVMAVLSVLMVAAFILSACQPVTTTVEVVKTQVVETTVEVVSTEIVKETQIVEVEKKAFTTPHPILGDLKVRQAIAHCTNKVELVQSVYPLITPEEQQALVMNTFIPSSSWAYAGDENITIYPFDTAAGGALLDEAGWTLAEGADYRANANGDELSLKFTTTTAAFRQTWAAVFEAQMKACGIRIIRLHAPSAWWFGDTTGLARRDFELGAFAWVGQADPSGETLWASDQIPLPENNWEGQNYMGWVNEVADKNIKLANNTLIEAERKAGYTAVQQEYTKDVPAIPLFNRTETYAFNPGLVNFAPPTGTSYYNYNANTWELPGKDTIVLGFTQEPASLYTVVESGMSAVLADYFIEWFPYTDQNFSYQGVMLDPLPTIESGLASNNDVAVKEGDLVIDAAGNPAELAMGMMIKDATGAEVEFTGAEQMKQLVVTYKWAAGLTYSDGQPVVKADFELGYKTQCDKENGATTFITCDQILSVEFVDDSSYTVTYKPGMQSPTYFLQPFGFFPAHRVIESDGPYKGMTLADVPAKDWPTLPEIAESPLGVGPYKMVEWKKGEFLRLEANEFFYLGAPTTKNIVLKIVTAENAEAQLLGGEIDTLDGTTLSGVTQTLADAAAAGTVKVEVHPSGTWEHIDFNLFVR